MRKLSCARRPEHHTTISRHNPCIWYVKNNMTSRMRSHMADKSRQTDCTHCATLDCTSTNIDTRTGYSFGRKIIVERVYMWNWLVFFMVEVDSLFDVSASRQYDSQCQIYVQCKRTLLNPPRQGP